MPISLLDLTARSPFEGAAAESQSLFSDNSNFRHPNPLPAGLPPFPSSPRGSSDWPMTPEPQSLFTSGIQKTNGHISYLYYYGVIKKKPSDRFLCQYLKSLLPAGVGQIILAAWFYYLQNISVVYHHADVLIPLLFFAVGGAYWLW